jgi:hypothetical protein
MVPGVVRLWRAVPSPQRQMFGRLVRSIPPYIDKQPLGLGLAVAFPCLAPCCVLSRTMGHGCSVSGVSGVSSNTDPAMGESIGTLYSAPNEIGPCRPSAKLRPHCRALLWACRGMKAKGACDSLMFRAYPAHGPPCGIVWRHHGRPSRTTRAAPWAIPQATPWATLARGIVWRVWRLRRMQRAFARNVSSMRTECVRHAMRMLYKCVTHAEWICPTCRLHSVKARDEIRSGMLNMAGHGWARRI